MYCDHFNLISLTGILRVNVAAGNIPAGKLPGGGRGDTGNSSVLPSKLKLKVIQDKNRPPLRKGFTVTYNKFLSRPCGRSIVQTRVLYQTPGRLRVLRSILLFLGLYTIK